MNSNLPKSDRALLRKQWMAEFLQTVDEVADAVDKAPAGRVIRDSEEPSRVALDRFRAKVYEAALQCKVNAAQAAFSPPKTAATRKLLRHKGRQNYSVLPVNGRLHLRRIRWHDAQEGSQTQTQTDALLDEAERTISEGVREMACRLNRGANNFQQTAENLARAAHLEVSKETLRQLINNWEGGSSRSSVAGNCLSIGKPRITAPPRETHGSILEQMA
jgi:hypothetical protein